MTDDRPSIAELQRLHGDLDRDDDGMTVCVECSQPFFISDGREPGTVCDSCAQHVVSTVLPVLLEIVAAAIVRRDTECSCGAELGCVPDCKREIAEQALIAALDKVLP